MDRGLVGPAANNYTSQIGRAVGSDIVQEGDVGRSPVALGSKAPARTPRKGSHKGSQ
jgi:hypothetical protein